MAYNYVYAHIPEELANLLARETKYSVSPRYRLRHVVRNVLRDTHHPDGLRDTEHSYELFIPYQWSETTVRIYPEAGLALMEDWPKDERGSISKSRSRTVDHIARILCEKLPGFVALYEAALAREEKGIRINTLASYRNEVSRNITMTNRVIDEYKALTARANKIGLAFTDLGQACTALNAAINALTFALTVAENEIKKEEQNEPAETE